MLLIKNARVYAPAPLGRMDILVAGGRIAAMEEALDPRLPGVEVLDAAGKTAVPGFIDQHVHITGGGGEGGLHTRVPELQLSAALRAGVTTLVGVLGTDSITRSVEGLVAKAKALTNEGITAYCLTSAYQYPPLTLTGSVMKDIVFVSEILGCKLAIADHRGSHPTREEIIRAAVQANAHDFICKMPEGYDTLLGASSRSLSGGEKQRVAISRALINDPDLILADEPTGNLDEDTAQDITEILKESAHKMNKCVVVVTHSNELAKQADVVFRLKKGELQVLERVQDGATQPQSRRNNAPRSERRAH